MNAKSISIYANYYKEVAVQDRKDYSSPAENLIRSMKLGNIVPKRGANKALDFGCGDGRHSEYLLKMGYRVLATDVSEEAVKATKLRLKPYDNNEITLMNENAKIDCQGAIFDLIVSWETMHWLGSKELFLFYLDEFKRVSKKDCNMIITMPTETHYLKNDSIEIGESQYLCKAEERKETVLYSPNLYTLKKIFADDYGFDIKQIRRYDHGRINNITSENTGLDNLFSMYVFTLQWRRK